MPHDIRTLSCDFVGAFFQFSCMVVAPNRGDRSGRASSYCGGVVSAQSALPTLCWLWCLLAVFGHSRSALQCPITLKPSVIRPTACPLFKFGMLSGE